MAGPNGKVNVVEELLIPDVVLEIGGRERHLRMDYNALAMIEKELDVDCLDYDRVGELLISDRVTDRRVVVWALLFDDDPTLEVRQVGRWLTFKNRTEVDNAILMAYRAAVLGTLAPLPSEQEEDQGEVVAGSDQPGETSGAQPATTSESATTSSSD